MFTGTEDISQKSAVAQRLLLNEAALFYLARGWAVLPVLGKQPAIPSWKELQAEHPTRDGVTEWFMTLDPAPTGVAVVTGRISKLIVVDCDSQDAATYWASSHPPSPLTVITGRGGLHLYYQAPTAIIGNRVNVAQRKIDIRGEGGYVVAPPSLHENRSSYAWRDEMADISAKLPVFSPEWIQDLDTSFQLKSTACCTTEFRNVAAYIARIHARAGEGGHSSTFRAACKLRDSGMSPDDALILLTEWNETNADPPWSAAELHHKVQSAYQVGRQTKAK